LPPPDEPFGHPPENDFVPESDILSPEEKAEMEEEAAWYHDSPTIMHLLKNYLSSRPPK
jgi:hypothetical protein